MLHNRYRSTRSFSFSINTFRPVILLAAACAIAFWPAVVCGDIAKGSLNDSGLTDQAINTGSNGLRLKLGDNLTPASGRVVIDIAIAAEKIDRKSRVLFQSGSDRDGLISLTSQRGVIHGIYSPPGGEAARIYYRPSRLWPSGSRHRIELTWTAMDDGGLIVSMRADGKLVGTQPSVPLAAIGDSCFIGGSAAENSNWNGQIYGFLISPESEYPPELISGQRTISIDTAKSVGECYEFWHVGNFPLTTSMMEHMQKKTFYQRLPRQRPFVKEINCVYLLGGRERDRTAWYKGLSADGKVQADFTGMIGLLKNIVDAGYTPRIVLDKVPYAMSDSPSDNAYGNTEPPSDEKIWASYVQMAVEAMIDAFGRELVGTWTFRVGTEPDLKPAHWTGTPQQYMDHYDYTVWAVKSVLPEARIGPGNILNPAADQQGLSMGKQWGLDIIDHAATGTNAVSGETGTEMDWFSCSWYGRIGFSLDIFDSAMTEIRHRLQKYPQFADTPMTVGEFAVLGDEYGRRLWGGDTTEWSASFFAALADRVYHHNVRAVYEWDQTTMGVFHPRAHVLAMLARMAGGRRLQVDMENDTSAARCGAISAEKDGRIFVLLYNHRMWRFPDVAETVELELQLPQLSPKLQIPPIPRISQMQSTAVWRISQWSIDSGKTVWAKQFNADCEAAGIKPRRRAGSFEGSTDRYYGPQGTELFARNIKTYRRMAELPQTKNAELLEVKDGKAILKFEMPGHSVRLLEIWPEQ